MKRILGMVLALLGIGVGFSAAANNLVAQVDRDRLAMGETITLRVVLDAQTSDNLNLKPLEQDFTVYNSGRSTQMSFVNGQQSVRTEWTIVLEPRREGRVVIPALSVGSSQTRPMAIQVDPAPDGQLNGEGADVFVEISLTPESPFVQQQALLRVRLYHAVPITEGTLSEPEVDQALIQRLGEDVSFSADRQGRRYQVIERRYAIFAEHSGELTIPAIRFQGRVNDQSSGRLGFFNPGRRVAVSSEPISASIKGRPENAEGDWLPAYDVSLTETWSTENMTFRVGEPVTRVISIEARGIAETLLPELGLKTPENISVYPDQPEVQARTDGEWVYASRSQSLALVPQAPGQLTLPEITLHWFDVENGQAKKATLPAKTITILPAVTHVASQEAGQPALESQIGSSGLETTTSLAAESSSIRFWQIVAVGFAAAWVITLFLWWTTKRSGHFQTRAKSVEGVPSRGYAMAKKAVQQQDAAALSAAIVQWARDNGHRVTNLQQIGTSADVNEETWGLLYQLDAYRYGDATWSHDSAQRLFANLKERLSDTRLVAANNKKLTQADKLLGHRLHPLTSTSSYE